MTNHKHHRKNRIIKARNIAIIIPVIILFIVIDPATGLFIGAFALSVILIRVALQHSHTEPVHECNRLHSRKAIPVAGKIEVFELPGRAPMEILYEYAEVLHMMAIHPRILIIRFNKIAQINSHEAAALQRAIKRLLAGGMVIFFSGVTKNMETALKKIDRLQTQNGNHIFRRMDDAMHEAEKMINAQQKHPGTKYRDA